MKKTIYFLINIFLITTLISCSSNIKKANALPFKSCMNIGNALDAPKDIKWDVEMKNEYFDEIKKAGFDAVRLPVRFSDYSKNEPNYKLDESFMKKLDGYINYALEKNLIVILDFHHFLEIMDNPKEYKECFLSVWSQVSERYKDYPESLMFELLNEPQKNLKGDLWNEFIKDGVETIRKTNKTRDIIIGPDNFYSLYSLNHLKLPKDNNLIVSFHYYEPNEVTFQSSPNHKGFENIKDITWTANEKELKDLKDRFNIVREYSIKNNVPIFLGEYGVNKNAPYDTRITWTDEVTKEAINNGFAYGYWELCSEFGIYNPKDKTWNTDILDKLINNTKGAI